MKFSIKKDKLIEIISDFTYILKENPIKPPAMWFIYKCNQIRLLLLKVLIRTQILLLEKCLLMTQLMALF